MKAFSLAETILGVGLLGTLLVLSLMLLPSCVTTYRMANRSAQAESLGQSQLESLRALPYTDLHEGSSQREEGEYVLLTEVLAEPGCQLAEAKRLRVTLSWSYRGRPQKWVREGTLHAPL